MLAMDQRINLKNILYLTDFSDCAKTSLPYAKAIASAYDGKITILHALMPDALACTTPELTAATITLEEREAEAKLREIAAQLDGQPHDIILDEGHSIWKAAESAILDGKIDVVVLGTHGRKGAQRFFLGLVAEEILRRSDVPVLIVGPRVPEEASRRGIFKKILVASDFSVASHRAIETAALIAQANEGCLTLLHVIKTPPRARVANAPGQSVANALGQLHDQLPADLQLVARPDFVVQYGGPAERIVQTAQIIAADVVLLGIRSAAPPVGLVTHIERTTAHHVIRSAVCPVLMIRG